MTVVSRGGAPPGERRSGPLVTTPEDRSKRSVATTATVIEANVTEVGLDGLPLARAEAYAPSARRRRWLAVVAKCPVCSRTHVHYGSENDPPLGVRNAGCRAGKYFVACKAVGR